MAVLPNHGSTDGSPRCPSPPRPLFRIMVVTATVTLTGIILGCMSISIGKFTGGTTAEDGTYCQEGEVSVNPGAITDVFYPAPYACPPNLELEDPFGKFDIVDQLPDRFRVRNTNTTFSGTLHWKARGMKLAPAAAVPLPGLPPPDYSKPSPAPGTDFSGPPLLAPSPSP